MSTTERVINQTKPTCNDYGWQGLGNGQSTAYWNRKQGTIAKGDEAGLKWDRTTLNLPGKLYNVLYEN